MKKLASALVLLTLFAACKKDDTHTSMRTNMITSGSWRLADVRWAYADPDTSFDISTPLPSAVRDNRYYFFSNGDLVTVEGATKLLPQIPDSAKSGTWKFTLADTKITFNDTSSLDIQRLTDSVMEFYTTSKSDNGLQTSTARTIYRR